jgi:elongation factor P hydroxylase
MSAKRVTTEHESKAAAHQHLVRAGFARTRDEDPPRWYHGDGRQASLEAHGGGRVTVRYRAAEPLESRIWEQEGAWHWSVMRSDGTTAGEGQCDSEPAAREMMDAVVATATRLSVAPPKRRRRNIVRSR